MSERSQGGAQTLKQEEKQAALGNQLKQAFPFPASGKFEDLLSAIDEAARSRRS